MTSYSSTFFLLTVLSILNLSAMTQGSSDAAMLGPLPERSLDVRDGCLQRCGKDNTRLPIAAYSQVTCVNNCIESLQTYSKLTKKRRKKRNVYMKCSPSQSIKQEVGNITNLSVDFKQRQDNRTWIANITWDVDYIKSPDIWQGFLMYWVPSLNTGDDDNKQGELYCPFINKNVTWRVIESGTYEWLYPNAIEVYVTVYPTNMEDEIEMKIFDPQALNKPETSSQRPSTTTSTNVPSTTDEMQGKEPSSQRPSTTTSTNVPSTTEEIQGKEPSSQRSPTVTTMHVLVKQGQGASSQPQYQYFAVSAGVMVGMLALVTLGVVYAKRRSAIRSFESSGQQDFEYDTSILYSSHDEHFVIKTLIPFLEKKNNFKCFVHYRNWEPGKYLHENMAYSVYNCRKIIAVISKNFLESNYCQDELSMALERVLRCGDSPLIVMNLDGVPLQLLPQALRTRTFLDLTSSVEKKTWKSRLYRQISTEEEKHNQGHVNSAVKVISTKTICTQRNDVGNKALNSSEHNTGSPV